uniref:Retrotransposon protein, putative, Ty3-gypsy subclass n=1 Tax=Oryza sativa subsp. japonica TaxID=39947 RepID=Q10PU8_ORYSJ|nr:retrotransposon protein, putative, Ty3-gypsy subclass [Oryza sativa Japonica Group]
MEFGWALRRPMQLPDSPRHERGLPAALRGVGLKPKVWCAWLEGVMRKVLSWPLSDKEAAVLHTHTATGVGVNGGGVVGGGFSVGVGEEESLPGVAASVAGGRKEERRGGGGTTSALVVGGGEEEERRGRGDPERQGLGLGGRTAARGRSGERWAAVTMVGAGAAMLGRCDDGGEARGAMVVRTAEEERLDSMKNPPHGGEGARECEEKMREREEG